MVRVNGVDETIASGGREMYTLTRERDTDIFLTIFLHCELRIYYFEFITCIDGCPAYTITFCSFPHPKRYSGSLKC